MKRLRPSSGNVVNALLAGIAAMATTSLAILVVAGTPPEQPSPEPAQTQTDTGSSEDSPSGDGPSTDPVPDFPIDPADEAGDPRFHHSRRGRG